MNNWACSITIHLLRFYFSLQPLSSQLFQWPFRVHSVAPILNIHDFSNNPQFSTESDLKGPLNPLQAPIYIWKGQKILLNKNIWNNLQIAECKKRLMHCNILFSVKRSKMWKKNQFFVRDFWSKEWNFNLLSRIKSFRLFANILWATIFD